MVFVLDCSVRMAWILPDEAESGAESLPQSLVENTAVAPGLWPIEVANALPLATRRGRIEEKNWPDLLDRLGALPIETDPETGAWACTDAPRIARDRQLSVYDAAYLERAMRGGSRSLPSTANWPRPRAGPAPTGIRRDPGPAGRYRGA